MNSLKFIRLDDFLSLGKIQIQCRFSSLAFYNLSLTLDELLWGERTEWSSFRVSFDEMQKIVIKSIWDLSWRRGRHFYGIMMISKTVLLKIVCEQLRS